MTRDVRAMVAFHVAFFGGSAVVALLDPPAMGWFVLGLALAYNTGLPLLARALDRPDWFQLWRFLLPLSIFQILPDWVLADLIGTLRFPDIGGPRLDDAITLAMAGMWAPPLFVAVSLARGRAGRAALIALAVFTVTEVFAPTIGIWEPPGKATEVAGSALDVLAAEAALGWATAAAYAATGERRAAERVLAALAVSTFYTGALVASFFLIDVAGWHLAV